MGLGTSCAPLRSGPQPITRRQEGARAPYRRGGTRARKRRTSARSWKRSWQKQSRVAFPRSSLERAISTGKWGAIRARTTGCRSVVGPCVNGCDLEIGSWTSRQAARGQG